MSLESAQVEGEYENVVRTILHIRGYRGLQVSASVTVGLGPFFLFCMRVLISRVASPLICIFHGAVTRQR